MLKMRDHGSIWVIKPSDDDADRFWDWVGEHVIGPEYHDEEPTDRLSIPTWDDGLAVEANRLPDLLGGLAEDGFKLSFGGRS
jgi:hypothetical protein